MHLRVRSSLIVVVLLALAFGSARAGVTERVSVRSDGSEGPGDDAYPAITPDGRFVAFSGRSDLVPGGSSNLRAVFVHDRTTGALTVDSPLTGFAQFPFLSGDARYVAFELARPSGNFSAYLRDRLTGVLELVSHALGGGIEDDDSYPTGITPDGRFVVFRSDSSDLITSDTNGVDDIFVADRTDGTITRASLAADGMEANGGSFQAAISADGRFVAFQSFATNLIPGEFPGSGGIFVRDRVAGTTERVSVASDGTSANDARSVLPAMSADGRFVAFESYATNLVAIPLVGQPNVYLHDRSTGATILVSAANGTAANSWSHLPSVSPDGRWVAFLSGATNLVPGDTNGLPDHFIFDRTTGGLVRASVATDGTQATGFDPNIFTAGGGPSALADGPVLAFATPAGNLVPGDRNGDFDTFVRDLRCGNGVLDPGEECDDGNDRDGDCCSATCRAEPDTDGDGVCDPGDDCPIFPDPEQSRAAVCLAVPYDTLSPQEVEAFAEGLDEFAQIETVGEGLGPVFN